MKTKQHTIEKTAADTEPVLETAVSIGEAAQAGEEASPAKKQVVLQETTKKEYIKRQIVTYATLVFAGFLNAFNMAAFVLPNGFVSGGVSGFALILQYVTNWNAGLFLIMFNLPLVVTSYFFIGKKFALKSLVSVVASSLFLYAFGAIENFWNYIPSDGETKLLPAAVGGVLSGVSLAIILKNGSSNGGTDVVATIIQKRRADVNIAWLILTLDMTSVIVSVFIFREEGTLFNIEPLVLALAYKFVAAKVCETILEGIKSAMKFEIVTTHPEEVSAEIMQKLHRGVTMLKGTGMYSHEERALLICVIRRRELSGLQRIVKRYPDTFCYISSTSDVLGKFSASSKTEEEKAMPQTA